QVKLNPGEASVSQLIHETASMFTAIADHKQIAISLPNRKNPEDDIILTDPQRLKQILINLINNGIKYNRVNGGLRISVTSNSSNITINVADDGLGIPVGKLEELFQPFTRLHDKSHDIEGSGLGLSICKNLAELLEGSIQVQSTPGEGSIFSLTLPRSLEHRIPEPEYFI
ncbi:MAG: ATP-binding protein, partial [Oceanospirillum sp.]|nr:ATP-binding protein [Oceanospirillum sp.]